MAESDWKMIGTVENMKRASNPQYTIGAVPRPPVYDSWPELLVKSAAKGATSLADIPKLAGQGIEGLVNLGRKFEGFESVPGNEGLGNVIRFKTKSNAPRTDYSDYIPDSEDARNAINKYTGIDLEPRPGSSEQRVAAHAAEFGGALANPATWLARGASLGKNALNMAKAAGTGASIGATSGVLQEGGVNPLVADIGATVANPTPKNLLAAFKKTKEIAPKIPMKIMGLSPKGINLEAAKAARDLGIDLPAAALTDSRLTGLLDQFVGKTPYFGNKLGDKYSKAQEKTKEALDKIYDQVGPLRTPEVEARRKELYAIRTKELPEGASIKPTHLEKIIDDIKIDTAILSPAQKALINELNELKNTIKPTSKLQSEFGNIKMPLQPVNISTLIGTKASLNEIIPWDIRQGVRDQLRKVQHAVAKDIEAYGKTNPEWHKKFIEADKNHAAIAKREKLEEQLGASINQSTGDLSYAALSKKIHTPKQAKLMRHQLGEEVYNKLQKLGTVARAMAIKNRSIPNPSGTAPTAAAIGYLGSLHSPETLGAIIGTAAANKLLTDKKFLDLAIKYAEHPAKFSLMDKLTFNSRVKALTGLTPLMLSRELKKAKADEEKDGL